jgi:hypothetical protein
MGQNKNTNISFYLKLSCLFITLGLAFVNPKSGLMNGKAKKPVSLTHKINSIKTNL